MSRPVTFAVIASVVTAALLLGLLPGPSPSSIARADCGDEAGEPEALFAFDPPAQDYTIIVAPPLSVTVSWLLDAVVPAGSTASLDWGDGSSRAFFHAQDCGDETIFWPSQSHAHSYSSPGMYTVTWNVTTLSIALDVPVVFVSAVGAPPATATSPPAPSSPSASPGSTPSVPPSPAPTAPPGTPSPGSPPAVSSSVSPTPASPTAAATRSTPTSTVVARGGILPGPPSAPGPVLPDTLTALPRLGDISSDPAAVATNVALAGVTIWVLLSSVLLNQVLQDNRSNIDAWTARLSRPLRRLHHRRGLGVSGSMRAAVSTIGVLLLTALIYGFLDPGFGFNRASVLLCLGVVIGVGLVTVLCSGIEVLATRRQGVDAAVRAYPAAIVVAVASVALSRAVNLEPGVIFGFVASAAITGPRQLEGKREGAVAIFPVLAALVLSLLALVAVEPLRASEGASASFVGQLAIAVSVIVFVGGIEGVALSMVPLSVTDGGKLFAWRKPVWAAVSLASAFLTWHVLLNADRQSFDALRQASTLSVLLIFVCYSALTVLLWVYFRRRSR